MNSRPAESPAYSIIGRPDALVKLVGLMFGEFAPNWPHKIPVAGLDPAMNRHNRGLLPRNTRLYPQVYPHSNHTLPLVVTQFEIGPLGRGGLQ